MQDVTGAEFKMFIDFLRSLSLFGQNAPVERIQELVEIIEGHLMPDHIHMLVSIPPKISVSSFMGRRVLC